jgi:methionyl-tRNA formyltransferase
MTKQIMSDKLLRIGLLATIDAPLLGYQIRDLLEEGCHVDAIIFDSKMMSEKDHKIHLERTSGKMPPISLDSFEKAEIPAYFVNNHNSEFCTGLVRRIGLNLLVNAGTPHILKEGILGATNIGVLNCHPGLLPKFRGCTSVEWAIYLDKQVGNTIHIMSKRIDEGPIVTKEGLNFTTSDTYQDVRVKVFSAGSKLMARTVSEIQCGKLSPEQFHSQGKGKYHSVIDAEKMAHVYQKLDEGKYVFKA